MPAILLLIALLYELEHTQKKNEAFKAQV